MSKPTHYWIGLFTLAANLGLQGCMFNHTRNWEDSSSTPASHLNKAASLIQQGKPRHARHYLVSDLRKNPNSCQFNLLNALSYHLEGRQNDYGKLKLAHVGYTVAKHSCHSNPWPYYYDAMIDFNQGEYDNAARDFAIASQLAHSPDEKEVFTEGLILSSYAARSFPDYEKTIESLITTSHKNQFIYKRLKAQFAKENKRHPTPTAATNAQAIAPMKQVIVDAIIILNRRRSIERRGINLLSDALNIQFGYSNSFTKTKGSFSDTTRVIAHAITIPDITYDLNIFNSASEHSEILARPTLLAEDGKSATYFSGEKLILGLAGSDYSSIETFPIGVTMNITPNFLEDGSINLTVKVGRDFILPTIENRAIQFENTVETVSENVETTVNVHYGETVILSALSEKERAGNVDRTPGISHIPLLKYLFREENDQLNETSVLILLTPQRYIGFTNTSVIDTHNYTAYMHNALFDPTTNIYGVLRELSSLSIYKAQEQDFYSALQFTKMTKKMLHAPSFHKQ